MDVKVERDRHLPTISGMPEDLVQLDPDELGRRIEELRARMRPLEQELAGLRAERDVLLTELRRRERLEQVKARADLKSAMKEGAFPNLVDLVAASDSGVLDDYTYNLRTGGVVRLGFPGARAQTIGFSDGRQVVQAKDLAEAQRYYSAGWDFGAPGRPGVRIHFPGTRLERLVDPADVFARPREG